MKITIEQTAERAIIERAGGVPVRVWRGTTEDGARVQALVALLAVPAEDVASNPAIAASLDEIAAEVAPPPGSSGESWVAAEALCDAAAGEPGAAGGLRFAGDPLAAPSCAAARDLAASLTVIAGRHGAVPTLDALASCYLHRLVARCGAAAATAHLDRLRDALPLVAAYRDAVLAAEPAAGNA